LPLPLLLMKKLMSAGPAAVARVDANASALIDMAGKRPFLFMLSSKVWWRRSAGERGQREMRQTPAIGMIFLIVPIDRRPALASSVLRCHNPPALSRRAMPGVVSTVRLREAPMKLGPAPLALVAMSVACAMAGAQTQAPARTASPEVAVAPATSPAPMPPAPAARRRGDEHADARVCLEFPTELQVVACAEKYRWAKAR
jgi:hypothetical protein